MPNSGEANRQNNARSHLPPPVGPRGPAHSSWAVRVRGCDAHRRRAQHAAAVLHSIKSGVEMRKGKGKQGPTISRRGGKMRYFLQKNTTSSARFGRVCRSGCSLRRAEPRFDGKVATPPSFSDEARTAHHILRRQRSRQPVNAAAGSRAVPGAGHRATTPWQPAPRRAWRMVDTHTNTRLRCLH
jgi:hypothetical protein